MTDVKQTIKTTTFQIANRMGIDSKHPKVRNFSVKFKVFSKDENHVQARACAIPYVTNDIYKKYPKQDYPSKDVAWFDVEVIFNTAFVKENAHKINTPAIYNLIVHELSHVKHGIEDYRSFFNSYDGHREKLFKTFVKKYAHGNDMIKREWTTGTSPSTDVPPRYHLVPHSTRYVMMLCPRCGYIDTGRYETHKPIICDFCGHKKPIKVIVSARTFIDYTYQSKRLKPGDHYHVKMVDLILDYMLRFATQPTKKLLQSYIDDRQFMKTHVYDRSSVVKLKRNGGIRERTSGR